MMNTASSVNSCHQSRGVAMAGDSHGAPGVVSRKLAGFGMQVNQTSLSQRYASQGRVHTLQSRWGALLSWGENNLLVIWFVCRLGHRFVTARGCYEAVLLRMRCLDKSGLYIVFPCGPRWNVLHPCLLQCVDTDTNQKTDLALDNSEYLMAPGPLELSQLQSDHF